ncbi:MAG: response regulator [Anaerolineae bacterium]|nr:response regulator [Anaerolineae bacterium]
MIDLLLVEHDTHLQAVLQDRLRTYPFMKFDVHTVDSGEEALLMAIQKPPQVVFLDALAAGSLNGYEVARRLRSHPETQAVKIVILSALDDRTNETMALHAGADAYLVKQASVQQIHAALDTLLTS